MRRFALHMMHIFRVAVLSVTDLTDMPVGSCTRPLITNRLSFLCLFLHPLLSLLLQHDEWSVLLIRLIGKIGFPRAYLVQQACANIALCEFMFVRDVLPSFG